MKAKKKDRTGQKREVEPDVPHRIIEIDRKTGKETDLGKKPNYLAAVRFCVKKWKTVVIAGKGMDHKRGDPLKIAAEIKGAYKQVGRLEILRK